MAAEYNNNYNSREDSLPKENKNPSGFHQYGYEIDRTEYGLKFSPTMDPNSRDIKNDGKLIGSFQWHPERNPRIVLDGREEMIPIEVKILDKVLEEGHHIMGTLSQYDRGFSAGIAEGKNRYKREELERQQNLSPEEKGQAEKERLVAKLNDVEFPYDEALILERTEPVKDDAQPVSYVTEIALGLDGIRKFLRMRFDNVGPELFTLSSTPIAAEDYLGYSEVADKTIAAYAKAKEAK